MWPVAGGNTGIALILVAMEGVICVLMARRCAGTGGAGGMLGTDSGASLAPNRAGDAIDRDFADSGVVCDRARGGAAATDVVVRTAIEVNARRRKFGIRWWRLRRSRRRRNCCFARIAYPIRAEISGHGVARAALRFFGTGRLWSRSKCGTSAAAEIWR